MPPAALSTRAPTFGSTLEMTLSAQRASTNTTRPKKSGIGVYLSCASRRARTGVARRQRGERLLAAGGIGCDRAQQFAQLRGRADIETAIGAARQPRDLAIGVLGDRVVAFLEHEHRHAEQAELAGARAQIVDRLLHGVADEDQRLHALLGVFLAGVAEHLADLGVAAAAIDVAHQVRRACRCRPPSRRRGIR